MRKIIFSLIFLFITSPLYSQSTVEEATRETDRLRREKIEEQLKKVPEKGEIELKPEEAPPKKEEQRFFITKINLAGCESFPPESFSSLIQKYENKEVTLTELDTLAKEIEREYLRRGVIAAVFLPPQEIKAETVTLEVVEAKMGELQIKEHKYFKKKRLNYYWQVPAGEVLRYDKISKSIQLMNKNPDRQVKASLFAGKKPGTTDILLTPATYFPVHFTSTFDKEGTSSTGQSRIGLGFRHNNFLGFDDTFLSGYTFGHEFNGIYAYHSLPIGYQGATLIYGYNRTRAVPKKDFATSNIYSQAQNTSLSLHQDLYKKDKYLGEAYFGFDAKDKTIHMNTGTYSRDRLRIFSLGGNFIRRGFGSTTYISPEISQGITAFGASSQDSSLASRGANSQFTKFNLGLQYKKLLPLDFQGALKFKTQYAATKLTPQEEFSLGGIDSVRGYPSGDYLADYVALTNLELLIPSLFIPATWKLPFAKDTLRDNLTSLIFLDYGWGERRGALPTEKETVNLLSIGPGLRFKLFDQILLRLEWGFPIAANYPLTETASSRFHISLDFQEKLPWEYKRKK